jgi:hypothetical protein
VDGNEQYNYAQAGPTQGKVRYFSDLWTLTVDLKADGKLTASWPLWTRRDAGRGDTSTGRPPERTNHRSFVKDDKLYVFGGYRIDDEFSQRVIGVFDDLWEVSWLHAILFQSD